MFSSNRRKPDYPHIANNGLRVTKRTSQAVTLSWPENDLDIVTVTDSKASSFDIETELDTHGNWFEVQMRQEDEKIPKWVTIYKGYGLQCEADGLIPDSLVLFRMKRNGEKRWGNEIIAATDPTPASTDDLNRAVEMNSEYLVTRILGITQAAHLKKILMAHDRNGMTPLMVACHNGNLSITRMLISCGAKVNDLSTGAQRTPLMLACIQGKSNIVQLLDQHRADWRPKDKSGCNAMHHAINGGNLDIIRLAFAKLGQTEAFDTDSCGWSPLMRAVIINDHLDIVKFLIGKGSDLNSVNRCNTKSVLMAAILARKPDFVQLLLEWGADPYYKNNNGQNCYEVACGLDYKDVAKVIRKHMTKYKMAIPKPSSIALSITQSLISRKSRLNSLKNSDNSMRVPGMSTSNSFTISPATLNVTAEERSKILLETLDKEEAKRKKEILLSQINQDNENENDNAVKETKYLKRPGDKTVRLL